MSLVQNKLVTLCAAAPGCVKFGHPCYVRFQWVRKCPQFFLTCQTDTHNN